MTNNEFYYLLLVLGAFGTFGIALAVAYVRYKVWLQQPAPLGLEKRQAVRAELPLKRAA